MILLPPKNYDICSGGLLCLEFDNIYYHSARNNDLTAIKLASSGNMCRFGVGRGSRMHEYSKLKGCIEAL